MRLTHSHHLVHGNVAQIRRRVRRVHRLYVLHARRQQLPRVVALLPPRVRRHRVLHGFPNSVHILVHPLLSIREGDLLLTASPHTHLVVTVQVRHLDLQPEQPALAQRLLAREAEQPATQVVAHMVEVWRDRVHASAEVKVHRIVHHLA